MTAPDNKPELRVISGSPDPTEIAALVAVLTCRAAGPPPAPRAKRSMWATRSRQVRPSLGAGPGSWRASTLPR
ncbi:MAG: acyl-CoA carboxylase subunit epsilon [Actinomycetes bacterium]